MYIDAIKEIMLKDEWLQQQFHESEAGKSWVMRHAPGTNRISKKLGVSASKARYHLNKLHKQGLVNKHAWAGGCVCWFPIGWDYNAK